MRAGLIALGIALVAGAVWLYPPAPTFAAQQVWNRWHAGSLALALDRSDASLAIAIGTYYFGNQGAIGTERPRPYDLPFAKRAFSKAIAIDPSISLARYMRARIEFIQGRFTPALADLDAELAMYPENKRVLYMRGLTYLYRGLYEDLSRAEQDFRAFTVWAPREWAGYNDLAFVLAKEKKYAEAAATLKEGIARADGGSKNPWLHVALGVMELNLGKPSAAIATLTKAQSFAATLTEADWQRAYPGNSPSSAFAESGIDAMHKGIETNLAAAYAAVNK